MAPGDAYCWSPSSISEAVRHGVTHSSPLQVQEGIVLSPRVFRRATVWPLLSPALVNYVLFWNGAGERMVGRVLLVRKAAERCPVGLAL